MQLSYYLWYLDRVLGVEREGVLAHRLSVDVRTFPSTTTDATKSSRQSEGFTRS